MYKSSFSLLISSSALILHIRKKAERIYISPLIVITLISLQQVVKTAKILQQSCSK